ncbi:hypothetical protein L226DRAFT_312266 [Lentinus tigrinus ALCF2SS1-7]|uniref:uncharacterized protein n=1 Tax=Lentinus tigrinus ALCF2SS1-7 TaxID=1328758 RepID=UPI001165F3EF|nr:hypothetical protein L226DRAFT_312266 [Lentinus tigrinus ALCF2SS1-7]
MSCAHPRCLAAWYRGVHTSETSQETRESADAVDCCGLRITGICQARVERAITIVQGGMWRWRWRWRWRWKRCRHAGGLWPWCAGFWMLDEPSVVNGEWSSHTTPDEMRRAMRVCASALVEYD